jgi:hypothetical protein
VNTAFPGVNCKGYTGILFITNVYGLFVLLLFFTVRKNISKVISFLVGVQHSSRHNHGVGNPNMREREREKVRERKEERERDCLTDSQVDRQTNRQTDR